MKLSENKDFVEIGVDNFLTAEQKGYIKDNVPGYTREGVVEEIKNWKNSSNKNQVYLYEQMLNYGKSLKPSNFTKDGRIILSVKNGRVTWSKDTPTKKE